MVVGAYAPTEDSDECVKDDFSDGLQQVLSRANVNQEVILLGDFNANINPMDGASDGAIVGPYGCWKRPTNGNGLRLLDLCGHFGIVLTNTLSNIKTKDIFTYKDKGPHGVWQLTDYVAIRRRHLYTLCQTSVLRGVQKLFPSADHHLVMSILMLWEDPRVRKVRKGSRNARPQLVIKGSQQQLADAVSTLSLTGLGWADGSKAIYDTAKAVVGTERRKARYWVYENVGEVDRIVAVRKAAGNTKEACDKARREFAALKDA